MSCSCVQDNRLRHLNPHDTLLASSQEDFLKDNFDFSYIGLENAVININRKDSVWNYQFIIDHFASNKKDTTTSNTKLNLKKIDIQKLRFAQNELWTGQKMSLSLGSLLLDADKINFNTLDFKIQNAGNG
ncbi:MAG: hypothetical protein PW786_13200 [Arachidicoccus sp.]|nr:hypothetical protein [Arachidicoccus sp.]